MDKNIDIDRELDRTKSSVFLGNNAAFLGSILCSLNFSWNEKIETARTNGVEIQWNPKWFLSLSPKERNSVLVHELWHVARLHAIRRGTRDPKIWNKACDYRINNDMYEDGYTLTKECLVDRSLDCYEKQSEEQIYEILLDGNNQNKLPNNDFGNDLVDQENPSPQIQQQLINTVVNAIQQAKISKDSGSIPGDVTEFIDKFLKPVIPWQSLLMRYMTDLMEETWSWKKPNRRFQDIYMPSRIPDDGRLEHLMYFLDVSGSISSKEIIRFFSEIKYIQEALNPKKLTLVQFDHKIQKIDILTEDQPFNGINIVGRGGTSLYEVHDLIKKEKPTAAVIFSDLACEPMEPVGKIPIIWVIINNPEENPSFGKSIHISI